MSATDDPITREGFIDQLLAARNAAQRQLVDRLVENIGDEIPMELSTDDARTIWHTAEAAIALMIPEYVPKREAFTDMRALLARYDELRDSDDDTEERSS